MSRELCNFDLQLLCVNNYRGKDYNKPETCVSCDDCIFHPDNQGLKRNPKDLDKVIKNKCKKCKKEVKVLVKGMCGACYQKKLMHTHPEYKKRQLKIQREWQKNNLAYFRKYYHTHKKYWQDYWKNVAKKK